MRISSYLTDEELAAMSGTELASWSETQAIGPWTANPVTRAEAPTAVVTIRLRPDVAAELEALAARHRQTWPTYASDLLLLGLRVAQARARS